mmetsp:Transcript_5003/g.12582  ORF Transcript_5003/g.12582 Transcript_5003/m.12582 type:complete len:214 (+) Transcript_5003:839-1480(+)
MLPCFVAPLIGYAAANREASCSTGAWGTPRCIESSTQSNAHVSAFHTRTSPSADAETRTRPRDSSFTSSTLPLWPVSCSTRGALFATPPQPGASSGARRSEDPLAAVAPNKESHNSRTMTPDAIPANSACRSRSWHSAVTCASTAIDAGVGQCLSFAPSLVLNAFQKCRRRSKPPAHTTGRAASRKQQTYCAGAPAGTVGSRRCTWLPPALPR